MLLNKTLLAHPGLSRAPHASAPVRDDCRATSDNSRDAILQSKKFDFITLWGRFPSLGTSLYSAVL